MIKDRLAALKSAQETSDESDVEVTINVEEHFFMEEFYNEVEDIKSKMGYIDEKVQHMGKKQSDILTDPALDEKLKKELELVMSEIKQLVDGVRKRLNMMDVSIETDEKKDGISANTRIRRIQHSSLMHKFLEIMTGYNKIQVDHREKCKERIQRQLEITGHKYSNEEIEDMLESGNAAIFTQSINTEAKVAKQTLTDIKNRHEDIMKLEKSIQELHDLFVDLGSLVESQGKMVDRIESQVRDTVEYVDKAKETTKRAVKFQESARKKKIICAIIAMVVLLVIILIIVLSTTIK